jgi:hypothetical protein
VGLPPKRLLYGTVTVSKTGNIIFSSPDKSTIHDDMLWALALACHAAKFDRSKPIILFGP